MPELDSRVHMLLDQLRSESKISAQRASSLARQLPCQEHDSALPIYLRVLIGVGAFFGSICFMGLVFLGLRLTGEGHVFIMGVLFSGLAFAAIKVSDGRSTVTSQFFLQSAFSLLLAGKALITYAVADSMESGWGVPLSLFVLTLLSYHLYGMWFDRFLSVWTTLIALAFQILLTGDLVGVREVAFNVFMCLQVLVIGAAYFTGKVTVVYQPLLYGFIFSVTTATLLLSVQQEYGAWNDKQLFNTQVIAWLFAATVIALVGWFSSGLPDRNKVSFWSAIALALLLGAISAPGILLSAALIIFGYGRYDRVILSLGLMFIPVFLFLYYYNLDASLLYKSGVLIGSGAALLLAWLFMYWMGWDKRAEHD